MDTVELISNVHELYARANTTSSNTTTQDHRPPVYKVIGISLAIASGCFIGVSFVLKKTGLLKANAKYNEEAGEGYGYLKNAWWWTGMTLMIIGEICNFVAYAFVDAILVTPLGALSVVITTILSAIFLKERLSFVGKIGCFNCIIGSVVIVVNAPQQSSVARIQDMQHFVIAPGFLTYAGILIVGCTFIALWVGPRYGKKTMLVYLSVCSLIGGLSVVATQGLGAAVVAQASGTPQFNQWFLYVLLVFVITTLVTEIVFLNVSVRSVPAHIFSKLIIPAVQKALNLFNAALVTPTYYVFFTSATIVTSAILFQGFKGTFLSITTVVMGFLQICAGVVLLQLSKSAKDVPDAAVFKGDLDQVREVAEQEQPETEPKADALRGTAALIRRISVTRQKMEAEEAKRLHDEKLKDQMEPIGENEVVEWDGLRRRKTVVGQANPSTPVVRRKTLHPPLGMSHFPDPEDEEQQSPEHEQRDTTHFFQNVRNRAHTVLHPGQGPRNTSHEDDTRSPMHPVALTEIAVGPPKTGEGSRYAAGSLEEAQAHIYGLSPRLIKAEDERYKDSASPAPSNTLAPEPPPHTSRRQFSFQNVFHRPKTPNTQQPDSNNAPSPSRPPVTARSNSEKKALKTATEEERLGLVKGDSHAMLIQSQHSHTDSSNSDPYDRDMYYTRSPSDDDEEDDWQIPRTQYPPYEQTRRPLAQAQPSSQSQPTSTTRLPPIPRSDSLDSHGSKRKDSGPRSSPELRNVVPGVRKDSDGDRRAEPRAGGTGAFI